MTTPTQQTKGGLVKELHGDLARKCRALVSKLEQIWRSHGQPQQAQAMRAGAAERVMDDDILDVDSRTRTQQPRPHKSLDTATAAMAKLEIETPPQKLELTDLISIAREQKATLDDNLHMLCTEPVVLAHVVNECFFSRPELVADEGGCILPAYTDKHTSAAVVEAVHNSIKSPAIWSYMTRLLELLGDTTDKSRQAVILQEIANLCHLEYTRAQALFRRQISTGTGMKYFQRVYTDAYDYGNACVSINAKPEQLLAQGDVQLSYALRLCQSETNASKAVTWIKELDQFHRSHPEMREVLFEREVDALADLAVIVSFIHSLSPAVSLPAHNRIKGPALVSQLESEINELRSRIDLGDFVIPIDNLLEPGMAVGALDALDRFIVEKTGTPLGLLYQGVIDQSILLLQEQIQAQVEKRPEAEHVPPTHEGHAHEVLYRCHRRPKEKTRRSHPAACEDLVFALSSSASEDSTTEEEQEAAPPRHRVKRSTLARWASRLEDSTTEEKQEAAPLRCRVKRSTSSRRRASIPEDSATEEEQEAAGWRHRVVAECHRPAAEEQEAAPPRHRVKRSTAEVFSTLLARSSDPEAHRRSVRWTAFVAAMVDAGFAVRPKLGSIYTFTPVPPPPRDAAATNSTHQQQQRRNETRPITLHRPHGPRIEGRNLLLLAGHLRRVYGWDEHTFEAA